MVESYCFESNTGESFNRSRKGSEVQGAKPICRSKAFDLEANSGRNAVSDKDSSLSCTTRDESVKDIVESKKIQDASLARTSYRKLFVLGVIAFFVLIYLVNL